MSRLKYFSQRFSLFFIGFVGLALLTFSQLETLAHYRSIIHWLAPAGLAISAFIAGQFGQGRLATLCILFGLASLNASLFHYAEISSVTHHTGQSLLIAWLCWRRDSALFNRAFLFNLLELGIISLAFIGSVEWFKLVTESLAHQLHTHFFNFSPDLFSRFTPFELLFYLAMSLPILVRLVCHPNHAHTLLLLSWLATLLIAAEQDPIWVLAISGLLAAFILLAVITFSFAMAYRDELTGIPSRRALMQHINGLGRRYVVVMADIDHFKKFNDTHGHDVGDQVLKLVAQKLNGVSGGGRAFRYGGEEFTLIFSGKSAEQVKPFVDLVRATIESYPIVLRAKDRPKKPPKKPQRSSVKTKQVHVTCSFGIAERDANHQDFQRAMKLADNALYAAKKAGRNCVIIAKQ